MRFEKYARMFSNLRTNKGRNRYPGITKHRAPHKPFLLLSVTDLIAQGQIITNFIAPTFDPLDTFNSYWSSVMRGQRVGESLTLQLNPKPHRKEKAHGPRHAGEPSNIPDQGYEIR